MDQRKMWIRDQDEYPGSATLKTKTSPGGKLAPSPSPAAPSAAVPSAGEQQAGAAPA